MSEEREAETVVVQTTLKNVEEGYHILTPQGLLPFVEHVEWLTSDGETTRATLRDDSTLAGAGSTPLAAVWHEDADAVTAAELAIAPSLDALEQGQAE